MTTVRDYLIQNGWHDSAAMDEVVRRAEQLMQEKGLNDLQYVDKLLRREFPKDMYMLSMGEQAPLKKAIDVETEEQKKNLAKAETQIRELLKSPVAVSGSLMPDACPAGNELGLPVGGVLVTKQAIVPSAHSADICCSMYASFYHSDATVDEELLSLKEATRFGPGCRSEPVSHSVIDENVWQNPFLKGLKNKAIAHMADQGDGNHFAFLGEIEVKANLLESLEGQGYNELALALGKYVGKSIKVIVTHHGSRGLGAAVYKRGIEAAVKYTRKIADDIPDAAAWIDSESSQGKEYWDALQYVARWTKANHQSIHSRFLENRATSEIASFGNEHNFVWKRDEYFYHGKGATPAWTNAENNALLGLIPLNMAEPILMVLGSDNESYNSFAPHGAGRNLSRSALFKKYRKAGVSAAQAIKDSTEGISVEWYLGEADLSECPLAYKEADEVIAQIEKYQLADVIGLIQPRGCIMAGKAPKLAEKPLIPKQKRQIEHRANRRKNRQRDWQSDEREWLE